MMNKKLTISHLQTTKSTSQFEESLETHRRKSVTIS